MIYRLLFAALAFLLTACSPAAPTADPRVPPTFGPIANGIMAEAGATSAAATGVAYIATGQAVNAIAAQATAEYRSTSDSLSLQQTQSVMNAQATAIEGTAQANVAHATQSAAGTSTAHANQQAIINVTIAYVGTQLAYDAQVADAQAQAEIMKARSDTTRNESVNDAISGLVWAVAIVAFIAAVFVSAGVSYIAIKFYHRRAEHDENVRYAEKWERVDQARIKTQLLLIESGRNPAQIEQAALISLSHADKWRAAVKTLLAWEAELLAHGYKHPFSESTIEAERLVTQPGTDRLWTAGYREIIAVAKAAGLLHGSGERSRVTWAKGWGMARIDDGDFDHVPLPYLPVIAPPDVKIPLRSFGEAQNIAVLQFKPSAP